MHSDPAKVIILAASQHFEVPVYVIMSSKRPRYISEPRQFCYWALKELRNLSLPQIGRIMDRDHTTVLSGIRRVKKKMAESGEVATEYYILRGECRAQLKRYWHEVQNRSLPGQGES